MAAVVEGCGVVSRVQACGANPESMSCVTTEHPNLPQNPDGGRTDGGRWWSRKEEQGDWVPSQMEGLAIKHGNGTNHSVWQLVGIQRLRSPLSSFTER